MYIVIPAGNGAKLTIIPEASYQWGESNASEEEAEEE